ncbi:hypothetical protein CAEBREN_32013 [Caenorhabditis brenneri]|uniref:Uncharacterized protein n=1 Tax=Caenorhabditis brenneri TaxID=135651 RepID=G0P442_CAEBE|nr:hypothetical protein CAEBREN_32013 [Caenorhabditis brenneri]
MLFFCLGELRAGISTAFTNISQASDSLSTSPNLSSNYSESMVSHPKISDSTKSQRVLDSNFTNLYIVFSYFF